MLSRDISGLGNNARVLSGPRLGDLLFAIAFNVMLFTVGWHYTKQVFGCMMVYAYFDKYPMSLRQRTITKYALLSIWWLNFAYGNVKRVAEQLLAVQVLLVRSARHPRADHRAFIVVARASCWWRTRCSGRTTRRRDARPA